MVILKANMDIDIDCLVRQIYGMNDTLEALNHADFQVKLRDALQNEGNARHEFLERDYGLLVGSLQSISGAVQILADGLLSGDLDIVASEPYSGAELDRMRKYTADILHRVDDVEVMRKIYTFTKTLIEG